MLSLVFTRNHPPGTSRGERGGLLAMKISRPRQVGRLLMIAGLTFVSRGAIAQDEITDAILRMQSSFSNCVKKSANNYLSISADRSMAVEQGFSACATEERAIYTWMIGKYIEPTLADSLLIAIKLKIKREIVDRSP